MKNNFTSRIQVKTVILICVQHHKLELSRFSFKRINFEPIHYITKITVKIEKKTKDMNFCHHRKKFYRLQKLHTSDFFMEKNKSLINIANKRGPKIDPCGTPIFTSY